MSDEKDSGRWPPRRCDMPDLPFLGKRTKSLILNRVFRGGGPRDHVVYVLTANFVSLVDQILREYEYGRNALLEYVNKNVNSPDFVIGPLFRATGHLENCLTYLNRSIKFAECLRRNQASPPIPRKLSVLSRQTKDRIAKLRNAVEHLYDDILKGKIPEGQPISLLVKSDSIELLGVEIFYSELAQWIKDLHSLSSDLAAYQEPQDSK